MKRTESARTLNHVFNSQRKGYFESTCNSALFEFMNIIQASHSDSEEESVYSSDDDFDEEEEDEADAEDQVCLEIGEKTARAR